MQFFMKVERNTRRRFHGIGQDNIYEDHRDFCLPPPQASTLEDDKVNNVGLLKCWPFSSQVVSRVRPPEHRQGKIWVRDRWKVAKIYVNSWFLLLAIEQRGFYLNMLTVCCPGEKDRGSTKPFSSANRPSR